MKFQDPIELFLPGARKPIISIRTTLSDQFIFSHILWPIFNSLPNAENYVLRIKLPNIKSLIRIRSHTSDIDCFSQVFINKEYDFPLNIKKPGLIIDGGANVGYASLFFANKFPDATIIAVEPEESNYRILKQNTAHHKRIKTVKAGIWNRTTNLRIKDPGLGKWGFMVEEISQKAPGSIRAVTIGDILKKSGYKEIDILKLDIEGAEKEVFSEQLQRMA